MKINRGDGILKFMVIAFPLVFLGNLIEYFAITKDNLKKIDGRVSEIINQTYKCNKGFKGKYSGTGLCERTIIKLENVKGSFHISDYADRDAYIEGIQKGDNVSVYIRKWYQFILTFGAGKDIYGLEKDGLSYYDIDRWKSSNISFMIFFGILTLFFVPFYILQRITVNELLKGRRV